MARPGIDASIELPVGRVVEYWEGGDPAGRVIIVHPGSPGTRLLATWGHEAAIAAGVRLVSVNRPGYGGSTSTTDAPSLLATGIDTAALAARLGANGYAVFGQSGGGPFAVATAVADPGHVRALGVVGGIGPWRVLDGPSRDPDGSKCLALLDAGDVAGAWDCMLADINREFGGHAADNDLARVDMFLAGVGDGSRLSKDAKYRVRWADHLLEGEDSPNGFAFDNLAWGATWDIDPRDVASPTLLWYGELDKPCPHPHGQWYADRIAGSELVILPGETHLDVVDGHWPEVLAGLLRIWA
jgi:pimeloyl-ACP methyl ester carboxylesterase